MWLLQILLGNRRSKLRTGCRIDYPQLRCEAHLKTVGDNVSVGQPDPLGQTGCPAGVRHYNHVVRAGSVDCRQVTSVDIFVGHLPKVDGSRRESGVGESRSHNDGYLAACC
jgi:hypothetical protein